MEQLFLFLVDGEIITICETAESAEAVFNYHDEVGDVIDLRSIIAPTLDDCWVLIDDYYILWQIDYAVSTVRARNDRAYRMSRAERCVFDDDTPQDDWRDVVDLAERC